jgi:hypothetical protein
LNEKLSYDLDLSAIVCDDKTMLPNTYNLQVNLLSATENNAYQNIAYQRIVFFLKEIFENSVILSIDNPHLEDMVNIWGSNHIVTLPCDPYDQIIGVMLFHKLSAIVEDVFAIDNITITSRLSDDITYTIEDDTVFESEDGDLMWCDRSDITTTDIGQISEDITWEHLDLDWDNEQFSEDEESTEQETEELEVEVELEAPKKKPRIIVLSGGANKDKPKDKK